MVEPKTARGCGVKTKARKGGCWARTKKGDLRFLEEGETQDKPRRHMKDEKQRLWGWLRGMQSCEIFN